LTTTPQKDFEKFLTLSIVVTFNLSHLSTAVFHAPTKDFAIEKCALEQQKNALIVIWANKSNPERSGQEAPLKKDTKNHYRFHEWR
jgi:hypothetical protein